MTPQDRLAAALGEQPHGTIALIVETILAADPTIAADMELGRRVRDANDPLLMDAMKRAGIERSGDRWGQVWNLRATLTEGEK